MSSRLDDPYLKFAAESDPQEDPYLAFASEQDQPGLLTRIGQDVAGVAGTLGRGAVSAGKLLMGGVPTEQGAAMTQAKYGTLAARPELERSQALDAVPGAREAAKAEKVRQAIEAAPALAAGVFPLGVAAETLVGGAVGYATGQEQPLTEAFRGGAFQPVKKAMGVDPEAFAREHPLLEIGGQILTGGGAEMAVRGGLKAGGRAVTRSAERKIAQEATPAILDAQYAAMDALPAPKPERPPIRPEPDLTPEPGRAREAGAPAAAPQEAVARPAPAKDLFGQEVTPTAVEQPSLLGGPDLAEQAGGAKETVARLRPLVESGDATVAEMERFDEALRLVNQGGKQTAEEVATKARLASKMTPAKERAAREAYGKNQLNAIWEGTKGAEGKWAEGAPSARGRATVASRNAANRAEQLRLAGKEVPDVNVAALDAIRASDHPTLAPEIQRAESLPDEQLLGEVKHLEDTMRPDQTLDVLRYHILAATAKQRGLMEMRPGIVSRELARTLGGAAVGAPVGAAMEPESPVAGAVKGAVVGAGLGYGAPHIAEAVVAGAKNPRTEIKRRVIDITEPLGDYFDKMLGTLEGRGVIARAKGYRASAAHHIDQELQPLIEPLKRNRQLADKVIEAGQADRILELARVGARKRADVAGLEVTAKAARKAASRKGATAADLRAAQKANRALAEAREAAKTAKDIDPARLAKEQQVAAQHANDPAVQKGVAELRQYYRHLLELKRDAGVITQETFDKVVKDGEYYLPLLSDMAEGGVGTGGRLFNRTPGIRRLSGTRIADSFKDPYVQAMLDTDETFRTVAKQNVTNMVGLTVANDPVGAAALGITKVPRGAKAKDSRTVEAIVHGKRETFQVDKSNDALWDAWAGFDHEAMNIVERVLNPGKRILQAGATLHPLFALYRNPVRDMMQAAAQYPFHVARTVGSTAVGGAVGAALSPEDRKRGFAVGALAGLSGAQIAPIMYRGFDAARRILKDDAMYQEFLKSGAGMNTEFYGEMGATRQMRKMMGDRKITDYMLMPIDGLRFLGKLGEESTRVARYTWARQAGKSINESTYLARDVSLDFASFGKDTKFFRKTVSFFNARLLGWDKLYRMMKDPKTAAMAAATVTAPSVALWMVNSQYEEYWNTPQWVRFSFWMVPRGRNEAGEMQFWYPPKPFELGYLLASIPEMALDYAHQKDPESLRAGLSALLSTASEGSLPVPTALAGSLEASHGPQGWDPFRNRPVVGYDIAPPMPKPEQFNEYTSSAAIGLERALPGEQSPAKLDYVMRSMTGGMGREALDLTTRLAKKTGLDKRPPGPESERLPFQGPNRSLGTGEYEMQVRRKATRIAGHEAAMNRYLDKGDADGALNYFEKHWQQMGDATTADNMELIKTISELRRDVRNDHNLKPAEKRLQLQTLNKMLLDGLSKNKQ